MNFNMYSRFFFFLILFGVFFVILLVVLLLVLLLIFLFILLLVFLVVLFTEDANRDARDVTALKPFCHVAALKGLVGAL